MLKSDKNSEYALPLHIAEVLKVHTAMRFEDQLEK